MRQVEAWVTSDGRVFTDARAAAHHAEERYGAALTALAHQVARTDKYKAACDLIEANLTKFQELAALDADRKQEIKEHD